MRIKSPNKWHFLSSFETISDFHPDDYVDYDIETQPSFLTARMNFVYFLHCFLISLYGTTAAAILLSQIQIGAKMLIRHRSRRL